MTRFVSRLLITGLLVLGASLPAAAQLAGKSKALEISAENMSAASPRHEAMAKQGGKAESVLPGDTVRYRLRFTNVATSAVHGIVLDNPIPKGLHYQPGSARADRADVAVLFSIDGGSTYSASPTIDVDVDGKREQRPAPADMYTHVRWTVRGEVPKGAQIHAEYDVQAK
ncbi:MAG TPA: hypothetical protein VKJ07_18135 [Mycobacteriales bacterium]|nr:hypothetical protein [Mycobacteriales bacterium]